MSDETDVWVRHSERIMAELRAARKRIAYLEAGLREMKARPVFAHKIINDLLAGTWKPEKEEGK